MSVIQGPGSLFMGEKVFFLKIRLPTTSTLLPYMSLFRSVTGTLDIGSARIGGILDLRSSQVTSSLNMDKLAVGQSLFMGKDELAAIIARNANVGSGLSVIGSKVTGSLPMYAIHGSRTLFI